MTVREFMRTLRFGLAIGGSLAASSVLGGGGLRVALAIAVGLLVVAGVTFAIAGLDLALASRTPRRLLHATHGVVVIALELSSGVLAFLVARAALGWLG